MANSSEKKCGNWANIECPLGQSTTIVVWRWMDEENIRQETLCDECARDLIENPVEVKVIWTAALDSEGVLV
jgi:hypothetical protein